MDLDHELPIYQLARSGVSLLETEMQPDEESRTSMSKSFRISTSVRFRFGILVCSVV